MLDHVVARPDDLRVGRLRHEVFGLLVRRRLSGVRAVLANVARRTTMRRELERQPIDALVLEAGRATRVGSREWGWEDTVVALRLADALARFAPGAPSPNCLDRAVGRYALLRALGWQATFVLGAPVNDANGACHAWVEVGGQSVLDAQTNSYVPLLRLPAEPHTP